jgi:mono/diheme cytochrome c family protein
MNRNAKRAAVAARDFFLAALAASLLIAAPLQAVAQPQTPAYEPQPEQPEDYPDNPGREEAFYGCAACHGFKIVAAQGFTRERWNETIDLMTERHGMAKLEGKDREIIVDYLAKTFPPKSQPRGFQNPFLKQ